jgi:hypothetical protein
MEEALESRRHLGLGPAELALLCSTDKTLKTLARGLAGLEPLPEEGGPGERADIDEVGLAAEDDVRMAVEDDVTLSEGNEATTVGVSKKADVSEVDGARKQRAVRFDSDVVMDPQESLTGKEGDASGKEGEANGSKRKMVEPLKDEADVWAPSPVEKEQARILSDLLPSSFPCEQVYMSVRLAVVFTNLTSLTVLKSSVGVPQGGLVELAPAKCFPGGRPCRSHVVTCQEVYAPMRILIVVVPAALLSGHEPKDA